MRGTNVELAERYSVSLPVQLQRVAANNNFSHLFSSQIELDQNIFPRIMVFSDLSACTFPLFVLSFRKFLRWQI